MTGVPTERLLVNFFYAHPAGHAVEALHYCLGHHAADPTREVSVALNAATSVESPISSCGSNCRGPRNRSPSGG